MTKTLPWAMSGYDTELPNVRCHAGKSGNVGVGALATPEWDASD